MSELRIVVTFPDGYDLEEQTEVLGELQQALKDQMGLNQRLTRLPQLSLPGGPQAVAPRLTPTPQKKTEEVALRVFLLEFPDAASSASAMRAVGGWYMRHPAMSVSLKADGPAGGVNLRLTEFSTVAFASVVAKINALMEEPDSEATDG